MKNGADTEETTVNSRNEWRAAGAHSENETKGSEVYSIKSGY